MDRAAQGNCAKHCQGRLNLQSTDSTFYGVIPTIAESAARLHAIKLIDAAVEAPPNWKQSLQRKQPNRVEAWSRRQTHSLRFIGI